jgi:hypothetical protein
MRSQSFIRSYAVLLGKPTNPTWCCPTSASPNPSDRLCCTPILTRCPQPPTWPTAWMAACSCGRGNAARWVTGSAPGRTLGRRVWRESLDLEQRPLVAGATRIRRPCRGRSRACPDIRPASVPQLTGDEHNDAIKFAFGVVGFVFAFFTGFVVCAMWGQINSADVRARTEGSAAVQMARDLTVFEKADSDRVRQSLLAYERAAVAEWPIAASGRPSLRPGPP